MKRVAPGSLHCKFSNLGAETSAFCNHAAQTAQVADEGNISIFEREGIARTKNDGSHRLRCWFSAIPENEDHPVQIAECVIWRVSGSAVECEIIPDQLSSRQ